MADFNAFPAMGIKPPEMAPAPDLASAFGSVEKIRAMQNENALAPLRMQAMQQQNQLQAYAMDQARKADTYDTIHRSLNALAATAAQDTRAAADQWNQIMSSFPEGKQWGEFSINKLNNALNTYGGQAAASAGRARGAYATAIKQADGLNLDTLGAGAVPGAGGGGGSGTGEPLTGSQISAFSQLSPQQTMSLAQRYNAMDSRLQQIANAKDSAAEWKKEQDMYPDFPRGEFNWNRFNDLKATIDARRSQMAALETNAQLGIPNPQSAWKAAGNNIFSEYSGEFKVAPETAYQKQEIGARYAEVAARREANQINRERYQAQYGTASPDDESKPKPDAEAKSIGNQTGLSNMALMWLSEPQKVPVGARVRVDRELNDYLRKNDIDTANFKDLWQSYGQSAGQNTLRFTQTRIMEHELLGTLDNLKDSTEAAGLGNLRAANVAKLFAGGEFNNDKVQKVAQQMNQLRSELIAYNVATRASKGGQNRVTDIDKEEAENTIKAGFAAGSITGLRDAVSDSTKKMAAVLRSAVDDADRGKWELLGKGDNYDKTHPEALERSKAIGSWGGGREGKPISDPGAEAILRSRGMPTEPAAPAALQPGTDMGGGFTYKGPSK